MNAETLLESKDVHVLFDGCPTCQPESSEYLDECRIQARQAQRNLRIIPSGSQTATLMRAIAENQGQPVEYPMILMDGLIRYDPNDITTIKERTTK